MRGRRGTEAGRSRTTPAPARTRELERPGSGSAGRVLGRATTGLEAAVPRSGTERGALRPEMGGSGRCAALDAGGFCALLLPPMLGRTGCADGRGAAGTAAGCDALAGRSRGGKGAGVRRCAGWRARGGRVGNKVAARRGVLATRSRGGIGTPARVSEALRLAARCSARCSPAAWRRCPRWRASCMRAAASSRRACARWGKRGRLMAQVPGKLLGVNRQR